MSSKYGSDPTIHQSTADTRERAYERLRTTGVGKEPAAKIADRAAREAHEKLNRR